MKITKYEIFNQIKQYLTHRISLSELVSWAELSFMEAEFDAQDVDLIRDIIAKIGLSDVKAFGLTWEDCEEIILSLGYKVNLQFDYA